MGEDEGICDYCADNGIGFISFSALAQGLLTPHYLRGVPQGSRMARGSHLTADKLTPELQDYLNRLASIAAGRGEPLSAMSLAWVLARRGVTSVLVGARSVEQLAQNIECLGVPSTGLDSLPLYGKKVF